jgi:hypothetical protein
VREYVRVPLQLEASVSRTTQRGQGEGGTGTRIKVGARVRAKAGTRARARAKAKAGGQNERVPNHRQSLRVREGCMCVRTCTPSPSRRLLRLCLHSHSRLSDSVFIQSSSVLPSRPNLYPLPSTGARDARDMRARCARAGR